MPRTEKEIKAALDDMTHKLNAVDDAELESETKSLATEEKTIVQESTEEPVDGGDIMGQNERAMNNWPIEARKKVAKRLLAIAKMMVEE